MLNKKYFGLFGSKYLNRGFCANYSKFREFQKNLKYIAGF